MEKIKTKHIIMPQKRPSIKLFPIQPAPLVKRILLGTLVGLVVIIAFLSGTGVPNPAWSKFWMIKPLVIVPLGGAAGGVFNYLVYRQDLKSDWAKIFGMVSSLIVFLIGLWLGIVLGLNGTYWD
jgi:hypothetical protein